MVEYAESLPRASRLQIRNGQRTLCWSWNAKDINPDEDDGKVWIPVMPKTLEEEAEEARESPHMPSRVKEMMVYPVG